MLNVHQLSKKILNKQILKDLSFQVDRGQIAIFLGGSGAGKSTLLRILNHLESYESGTFALDGAPLDLASTNRKHLVGMIFQHFNLFDHLNAEENITLALIKCQGVGKEEAQGIAKGLLEKYGLEDKGCSKISKLSGGQKQRLAIARTLALNPEIICFDEPTSALDPTLTNQVARYIKDLAEEKRIVLLTTHDMNLVEQLDGKLFLIEGGTIVESASRGECIGHPQAFPKLNQFLNPANTSM
jgi:ABC-type polar amino acid transport system ATPase subunit